MLKDYFSFSRRDLKGIYLLLGMLVLILLLRALLPLFFSQPEANFSEFDKMILALENARRAEIEAERSKKESVTIDFNRPDREIAEVKLNPFPFDPNEMTESSWSKLGLSMRQIRNIQNFQASGGSFRRKEDFRRIFTISDDEYEILEPFIVIADAMVPTEKEPDKEPPRERQISWRAELMIDINRADSTELLQLRGIGPAFARRIVRYRELIGGFHSPEQLFEVFGFDSARYEPIAGNLHFDPAGLRLIDVNNAELKDLTAHPYIDFYLAKSIVDERIKRGGYNSASELYGIPLMHDALYRKVIPYFKFENENHEPGQ